MHIAISYPMDTVRKSFGKPETILGRAVANHGFLLGLANVEAGHRITLFVPSRNDVEYLNKTLLAEIPADIHVVTRYGIASYIEEYPIEVLHFMDPKMSMGGSIRNQLTDLNFVITGMTHSLGDQIMDCILMNHANGIETSDCLVCTTPTAQLVIESMCASIREHQPDLTIPQTEVIPLGLDLAMFREPTKMTRQDLGLSVEDFVILSFARFNPLFKMDAVPVLNLLAMLQQKSRRRIKFVLAGSQGDGRYVQFLQDWASKNGLEDSVQFVLSPSDEQKKALYQLSDIFLSLSDNVQETFGLTVIEALASGLPCVVSDWNGYKALIENEINGLLVPTKMLSQDRKWEASLSLQPFLAAHLLCAQTTAVDLPAARDAILRLEADPQVQKRMSEAAAESAADYDWKQILPRYFKLWKRLREKQLAKAGSESERNRRTSTLRFLHNFSSYPSTRLSTDDRFITSELGRLLLEGKQSIQPYEELQEILDLPLITGILSSCLQERSVQELFSAAGQDAPGITQNLMWLYKYGYLEAL